MSKLFLSLNHKKPKHLFDSYSLAGNNTLTKRLDIDAYKCKFAFLTWIGKLEEDS